jgi:hypothetical protein
MAEDPPPPSQPPRKANLLQVLWGVLAALFGVQSEKNQQRDFSATHPWAYILVGLIATVMFVVGLVAVVFWIVRSYTP